MAKTRHWLQWCHILKKWWQKRQSYKRLKCLALEAEVKEEVVESVASEDAEQGAVEVYVTPRLTIRSIQALNPGMMSISGNAQGGQVFA